MSKTKHKLDIFEVLDHISQKDTSYYRNLSEEQQKAFVPLTTMRWLSGTRLAKQVYFINELINPNVFTNHTHKELLYYLLTICGPGKKQRYVWNKQVKKSTSTPTIISIIREYFGYSTKQAVEAMLLLSNDDIMFYAEELGSQREVITKLKKELKGR